LSVSQLSTGQSISQVSSAFVRRSDNPEVCCYLLRWGGVAKCFHCCPVLSNLPPPPPRPLAFMLGLSCCQHMRKVTRQAPLCPPGAPRLTRLRPSHALLHVPFSFMPPPASCNVASFTLHSLMSTCPTSTSAPPPTRICRRWLHWVAPAPPDLTTLTPPSACLHPLRAL
jgi:hypothetical protein